jgi:hypothetical protein
MGKKSKKNTSNKKQKDTLTASKTYVDNSVNKSKKIKKKDIKLDEVFLIEESFEPLDITVNEPEIFLDTVPTFDEEITFTEPVEKTEILEPVSNLINIPDRWYIKIPEDKEFDPILNFYKDNTIIASFPLNEENLKGIMPILDTFYERPETKPKENAWIKTKKWAKKHKFTATIGIIVGIIVVGALLSSAFTSLGLGAI